MNARDPSTPHGERAPDDEPAPLLSAIELPASLDVTTHNWHLARFKGWVVSTRGRQASVQIRVGSKVAEMRPTIERPDVAATLADVFTVPNTAVGFDFYVELPRRPWRGEPTAHVVFRDDTVAAPERVYRFLTPNDGAIDTYEPDSPVKRALAARWLRGRGLEFGALHQPLAVDPSQATVVYADRWTRPEAIELFPELASEFAEDLTAAIVDPTFRIDLDTDDLSSVEPQHFDFFIANDVMEHLANPIRFLKAVADVMTPGSRLFLSIPDGHYTHDANRPVTPRRHLWQEYRHDVTAVDDAHVLDHLEAADQPVPTAPDERQACFDDLRRRSFHVHVWDDDSFGRMLRQANRRLSLDLDVLDHAGPRETGGGSVWVLQRR